MGDEHGSEHGSVTIFVVFLFSAALVFVALLVDGSAIISARLDAHDDAARAARAGAQQIRPGTYATTGHPTLDPASAKRAARAVASTNDDIVAGETIDVRVSGSAVTVTVERTVRLPMLSLIGIDTRTVEASATANAYAAVQQ